jgi:hypothetical protein
MEATRQNLWPKPGGISIINSVAIARIPMIFSCNLVFIIFINVPLFLEVRDFMFFRRGKHIISHFAGFFEGAKTFLTFKLSWAKRRAILTSKKSRPPQKPPRNG